MSFMNDLSFGKKGEDLVYSTAIGRGHTIKDVRDILEFRKRDIDFIIDEYECEVKTDRRIAKTNNLFIETESVSYKTNKISKGWFDYCEAEYLFYLDWENKILYIYKFDDIKEYIRDNWVPIRECKDTYKIVRGYCLNKDAVPHQTLQL